MIRVKPDEGNRIVISKSWFEFNGFFTQHFKNLAPAKVYEVKKVVDYVDEWGISSIQDVETLEIFDIEKVPELDEYYCFLNAHDSFIVLQD